MLQLNETKGRLVRSLKRHGQRTVDQLSVELQLSRTATRAQLLWLEKEQLIERIAVEGEGRGRPPLAFGLTTTGNRLFPTDDATVLGELLTFLEARGARALVHAFFSEMWNKRRQEFEAELDARGPSAPTLETRLEVLRELLQRDHFMPELTITAGTGGQARLRVLECNCPLPSAVRATKLPCQLESQFLVEATGGRLDAMEVSPTGRAPCRFEIVLNERS